MFLLLIAILKVRFILNSILEGARGSTSHVCHVHEAAWINWHGSLRVLILVVFINPAGEINGKEVRLDLVFEEPRPEGAAGLLLELAHDSTGGVVLSAFLIIISLHMVTQVFILQGRFRHRAQNQLHT